MYRWEQSGEISGMTRVRGFTQDDAHLFVTEDQIAEEVLGCIELVQVIFGTLGMEDYRVRVGLRDPDSSKYVGEPEKWDRAEQACRDAAASLGVPFTEEEGEAAFYGPKIDFVVRDVLGREWQLGTVQVDYNLPERFDLLCGCRWRKASTRDDSPRALWKHGAILWCSHRTLLRHVPHLALSNPSAHPNNF